MKRWICIFYSVLLLTSGCVRKERESAVLFNAKIIKTEFHETRRSFLESPLVYADAGFMRFLGLKGATTELQQQEWRTLRELELEQILRSAERASLEIFNRSFLERSCAAIGVDAKSKLDRVVTDENVMLLEFQIATSEMQKRMAPDTALLLAYRQLAEK